MKHFEGSNTAMNIHYKSEGDTWQEIYDDLVLQDVMHQETYEEYIIDKHGYDVDHDFNDEDGEFDCSKYDEIIYNDVITDDEYLDVMERDNGNAFYQSFYENDEDYRNGVTI